MRYLKALWMTAALLSIGLLVSIGITYIENTFPWIMYILFGIFVIILFFMMLDEKT